MRTGSLPSPPPQCFSPPARAFLFPPPFCGALVRYYSTTPPFPLYPLSRSGRTRWAPIRGCCDCSRELRSSVRRSGRRPFEKRRPFQLVALCAYPSPLYLHPCFVLLLPRLLLLHRPRLPVRPSVRRKATATLPPPPLRPELLLLDFVPLPPSLRKTLLFSVVRPSYTEEEVVEGEATYTYRGAACTYYTLAGVLQEERDNSVFCSTKRPCVTVVAAPISSSAARHISLSFSRKEEEEKKGLLTFTHSREVPRGGPQCRWGLAGGGRGKRRGKASCCLLRSVQ